jgi:hypothetical protein
MIQQKQFCPESLSGNICVFSVKLWLYFFTGIQDQSTSMTWYIFLDNSSVIFREFILACWSCCLIKVKTKLPNSEQSYKGKVQTDNDSGQNCFCWIIILIFMHNIHNIINLRDTDAIICILLVRVWHDISSWTIPVLFLGSSYWPVGHVV